jgi:hypothetical protein
MSNKSQFPRNAKGQGLREILAKVAEEAKEKATESQNDADETPQAQGQLPLPKSQLVAEYTYQWVWEPILDTVSVIATYAIQDDKWTVDFKDDRDEFLQPDDAKKIGEAFLAAWNWQFIWKEHFADMMLDNARKPKLDTTKDRESLKEMGG